MREVLGGKNDWPREEFIFAFFLGSVTAFAQNSSSNGKKLDSSSIIKQLMEAQKEKNKKKPQWQVRPVVQYKYGIRPRPIIDGDIPILEHADMAGEKFRASLHLNSLIVTYTTPTIAKRRREQALAKLRKSGNAASEQVDRRIKSTELFLADLRKQAASYLIRANIEAALGRSYEALITLVATGPSSSASKSHL